ncbi:MAG: B12-binding domain-containing protein [Planctomycetota bacterium]
MAAIEYDTDRFFEILISGERDAARAVVDGYLQAGSPPEDLLIELYWPTYEKIEKLFRHDQLSNLAHHYATRLLRVLVDQTAAKFVFETSKNRRVIAFCGQNEPDELAGQMAVDLLELSGFTIKYAGGGIPRDEILAQVHEESPDVLLLFGSSPQDLPEIRLLIDSIREIGAVHDTQIAVGGGVFNRASGLAEEIGADIWAADPLELAHVLIEEPDQRATADQRTVGRKRKAA